MKLKHFAQSKSIILSVMLPEEETGPTGRLIDDLVVGLVIFFLNIYDSS